MKNIFTAFLTLISFLTYSQDITDTEFLLHETEDVSARSMAVAGSFGAVGADLSSATNNPAGVAFFRKKELGLGLSYHQQTANSMFQQNETESSDNVFRLKNIAFVYANLQTEWLDDSLAVKRNGLVSWSLTAGLNQKSDLQEIINYNGFNASNSLLTGYVNSANQFANSGVQALDFFERQAYDVDLLEAEEVNGQTIYSSEIQNGQLQQHGNLIRTGAKRDFYLAGGMNFSNKIYVGATIGIPYYIYEDEGSFREIDEQNQYANFESLESTDNRNYTASGGYLNLGAIYRVSDYFRAGLNVRTPTVVEVTEESTLGLSSIINGNEQNTEEQFESSYTMTLPWKAGLQMVASHPMYGLISLEGDFVDYSSTRLDYDDELGDYSTEEDSFKDQIQQFYKGTFNVRMGAEARLMRDLRLRGGVAYYDSPYKNEEDEFNADYAKQIFGLGLGYRFQPVNIMVDLGFNHKKNGEFVYPYLTSGRPNEVVVDKTSNQLMLSITKRWNN